MAGKELIEIKREDLENKESISEEVAHQIIASKQQVLMVFERPDGSLYWYNASVDTDLWHAKKQTINELVWFYRDK